MPSQYVYKAVRKYHVEAKALQPLRVGSTGAGTEDVLLDPVDEMPMIQASSIAGAFRSYYRELGYDDNQAFGSRDDSGQASGQVSFTDGHITNAVMEMRPRVRINPETGSVSTAIANGSRTGTFGQKFNILAIGAGCRLIFDIYIYQKDSQDHDTADHMEKVLAGFSQGKLFLGSQKSNGFGSFGSVHVYTAVYDLTRKEDRKAWSEERPFQVPATSADISAKLRKISCSCQIKYEVVMQAETIDRILVKSIAVTSGDDVDAENIRNAGGEYIIPGSSVKGSLRSQMERIADYLEKKGVGSAQDRIYRIFGSDTELGQVGNIRFSDTVVHQASEDNAFRIHVDKFTGGVIDKALFHEKNISGQMEFHMEILNRGNPDETLGLLLLALRDTALGDVSFGSGYANGKGLLNVKKIRVASLENDRIADIDFINQKIEDNSSLIQEALNALKGGEKQ